MSGGYPGCPLRGLTNLPRIVSSGTVSDVPP